MTAASALDRPQFTGSTNITVTVVNLVAVVTHKLSSIAPCTPVSSEAVWLGLTIHPVALEARTAGVGGPGSTRCPVSVVGAVAGRPGQSGTPAIRRHC